MAKQYSVGASVLGSRPGLLYECCNHAAAKIAAATIQECCKHTRMLQTQVLQLRWLQSSCMLLLTSGLGMQVGVKEGVVFLTYSSLTSSSDKGDTRLQQLVEWAGPAFDGLVIFDECHKAKNLVPEAGSKSTKVCPCCPPPSPPHSSPPQTPPRPRSYPLLSLLEKQEPWVHHKLLQNGTWQLSFVLFPYTPAALAFQQTLKKYSLLWSHLLVSL